MMEPTETSRFPGMMNCRRRSVKASPSRSRKPATPLIRNFRTNWPKPLCASSLGGVVPSVSMRIVADVSGRGHHHGLLVDGGRVHFRDEFAFGDDKNAV